MLVQIRRKKYKPTGYSRWRVVATDTVWVPAGGNSDNTIGIREFALFESTDYTGVNLASGGTPSVSSQHGSFPGTNINDNNANTFWISAINSVGYQQAQVTLSVPKAIRSVIINWCDYNGRNSLPKSFDIQCSADGVTWITKGSGVTPNSVPANYSYTSYVPLIA